MINLLSNNNFDAISQTLRNASDQEFESGLIAKIKRMWSGHSYAAIIKDESGEIIGLEKVLKKGNTTNIFDVTKYVLSVINTENMPKNKKIKLLSQLRNLNIKILNFHKKRWFFNFLNKNELHPVEKNLMLINEQYDNLMPKVLNKLHPDQVEQLDQHLALKREVGQTVMQKIHSFIRRIESYIANRMGMARLALQTRDDLVDKLTPIKRRGGSANEVFITPKYVIKAEASHITDHTMVKMERFTQDIAHELDLEGVVLPTVPIKLSPEQAKKLALTSELMRRVEESGEIEVNLARYAEFSKPDGFLTGRKNHNIDLESYQVAALFSGITQQTDHHQENGGVIFDKATGKYKFLLFDNDICMHDSNALSKSTGKEGQTIWGVPIRSFFLAFPQKNQPLMPKLREIISKWDTNSIMEFIDKQEVEFTEGQKAALRQRIEQVKQIVANRSGASIYDCFKAMYPLLSTYFELYQVLNSQPVFTTSVEMDACVLACSPGGGPCVSLTDLLQEALGKGKITQTRHDEILHRIIQFIDTGDVVSNFSS